MALSVITEPPFRNAAYNPIITRSLEDNLGTVNGFKYLYAINDVYNSLYGIDTARVPAMPDGTGLFNASEFIKSYISFDIENITTNAASGPALCQNSEFVFSVDYGYEVPGKLISNYNTTTSEVTFFSGSSLNTTHTYSILYNSTSSSYPTLVLPGVTITSTTNIDLYWNGSDWFLFKSGTTTPIDVTGSSEINGTTVFGYLQSDISDFPAESKWLIRNVETPNPKIAFNIVRQYDEFLDWSNGMDFVLHQKDSKFLSKVSTAKKVDPLEYETLSFIQELPLQIGPKTWVAADYGPVYDITSVVISSGQIQHVNVVKTTADFTPYDLTGIRIPRKYPNTSGGIEVLNLPGITISNPPGVGSYWYLKQLNTSQYELYVDGNMSVKATATGSLTSNGSFQLGYDMFPLITNSTTPVYDMNGDLTRGLDFWRQTEPVIAANNHSSVPINWTNNAGTGKGKFVYFTNANPGIPIQSVNYTGGGGPAYINIDDFDLQNGGGTGRNIPIDYTGAMIQTADLTMPGITITNPNAIYYLKKFVTVATGNTEYQLYRDAGLSDEVHVIGSYTGGGHVLLNVSKVLFYPLNMENARSYWLNVTYVCPPGMKLIVMVGQGNQFVPLNIIPGISSITQQTYTLKINNSVAFSGIAFQFVDYNSNPSRHRPYIQKAECNWITQSGDSGVYYTLRGWIDKFMYTFYAGANCTGGQVSTMSFQSSDIGYVTYPNTYVGPRLQRFDMPAGPANIDAYLIATSANPKNWSGIGSYKVQVFGNLGGDISQTYTFFNNEFSEPRTYNVLPNCDAEFEFMRLVWVNTLGGLDYYTFKQLNEKNLSITKQTFNKPLAWNYTKKDRGETVFHQNVEKTWKLNSDWISFDESEWLADLFTSGEVYILNSDGSLTPVIVQNDPYSYKMQGKDKLKMTNVTAKAANKILSNI
jgi:hypothetical protein